MTTVRLSTGYEVEFDFGSKRWKKDLTHLAHAIIGERLAGRGRAAKDQPVGRERASPLEEDFLEEIRYIVLTADDLFKHSLIAAVILDAVDKAYRAATKAAELE
jgi:hypothetical protein